MDKRIKREYRITQIIVPIAVFIIFALLFINEDKSAYFVPPMFALIAFALTFPGMRISEKIIAFGNKIKSAPLRVLFYILFIPIILLVYVILFDIVIFAIVDISSKPHETLSEALGGVLLGWLFVIVMVLLVVVPYLQALIVLFKRNFKKK